MQFRILFKLRYILNNVLNGQQNMKLCFFLLKMTGLPPEFLKITSFWLTYYTSLRRWYCTIACRVQLRKYSKNSARITGLRAEANTDQCLRFYRHFCYLSDMWAVTTERGSLRYVLCGTRNKQTAVKRDRLLLKHSHSYTFRLKSRYIQTCHN